MKCTAITINRRTKKTRKCGRSAIPGKCRCASHITNYITDYGVHHD